MKGGLVKGLGAALCAALAWSCGPRQPAQSGPVVLATVAGAAVTDQNFASAAEKLGTGSGETQTLDDWRRQLQLLIDRQLLLFEGRQQGLDNAPQVLQALETWERGKQIELLMKKQLGGRLAWDDAQLAEFFASRGADREIRLSRLVLRDRKLALAVLQRARKGEKFERLVAEQGKGGDGQTYSGELGWFNPLVVADPRLTSLFDQEVGAVELIESEGAYFLLTLTDKRQVSLQDRRQLAEQALTQKRQADADLAYLEFLIGKYEVRLDTAALQQLQAPAPLPAIRLVRSKLGDWSIGDYQRALKALPQPEAGPPAVVAMLSLQVTRTYIVDQLLAREVQEQGLEAPLREAHERLHEQKIIEALWERQGLRQVPVSEEELEVFYQAHKAGYPPPPPTQAGLAEWQGRVRRDLQEEKAAPLFESYLASLRQRHAGQIHVDEEGFQAFVARRRQAAPSQN
ncbi:MAG: peptidylprolyl isomerase [Candidatus Handelsmanbacteria bacterium]|nr:peptidylprolyl isomerase [Candidatus Handelsmanbacteria bacterium]